MPRDLSPAMSDLMDLLAVHPDWTDARLASESGRSVKAVERLMGEAYRRYGVQSRTGAVLVHIELRRRRRARHVEQAEGLGL